MTATLDGFIATGATFEAVADEAESLGYQLRERRLKPPVSGSVFVDQHGLLHRVRYQLFGWVISIDGDSKSISFGGGRRSRSADTCLSLR